tara:strand:+ start:1141 stop:1389 length:249 start_codon:yes stop_codon:yes gene_type:complete
MSDNSTPNTEKALYDIRDKLTDEIHSLNNELFEKKLRLNTVMNIIRKNCEHVWITDYIDSINGYKESQMIKYCEKCEATYQD